MFDPITSSGEVWRERGCVEKVGAERKQDTKTTGSSDREL